MIVPMNTLFFNPHFHPLSSWGNLTFLGDSVVLLPAAAVVFAWLLCGRAPRLAWAWCLLFGGALTLVLASKLAFVGWGIGSRTLDFTGFSGHAMRACAVLPVMAYLCLRHSVGWLRVTGLAAAYLVGALIGVSRVLVHAHSVSEAVAGALLGVLISALFIRWCSAFPRAAAPRWVIALSLLALLPSSQAAPAPTEQWVNQLALYLSGHERPYQRDDWWQKPPCIPYPSANLEA
jgi:membrane-associated phospholipid phosphatase